jgi:hypothetical protein
LKPFRLNVLRLRKQGICSSFCESGKFHDEPKAIRDLASKELVKNSRYRYATTAAELRQGVEAVECLAVKATNELIWKRTVHYQDRRRH